MLLRHTGTDALLGNRSTYSFGQVLLINLGHVASHLDLDGWLTTY
ncbi:hypothetical protein CSB86_2082 [Pseudomonas aeruginosa]|nr:hypothetical protein CSB86_2082 [Pseudomonas aeruginosa]